MKCFSYYCIRQNVCLRMGKCSNGLGSQNGATVLSRVKETDIGGFRETRYEYRNNEQWIPCRHQRLVCIWRRQVIYTRFITMGGSAFEAHGQSTTNLVPYRITHSRQPGIYYEYFWALLSRLYQPTRSCGSCRMYVETKLVGEQYCHSLRTKRRWVVYGDVRHVAPLHIHHPILVLAPSV